LHPRRILIVTISSCVLGIGSLCLLGGCNDEYRTTGTQVQLTPEDKAEIEGMRAAMKQRRAEEKQEQAEKKKERIAERKKKR